MEFVTRRIKWERSDHGPWVVRPIGDIQWAGKQQSVAVDILKRDIDSALEFGNGKCLFLGMGDYIDTFSPSNRQRIRAAALYDTAEEVIDQKALDLVGELYDDVLKPTKGLWLGLLAGHHWHQLKYGDTTDMRLCEMLDAPFLGDSAIVRLVFEAHGREGPVTLWAHHGAGSGQKGYAPVQKLENAVYPDWEGIDIFLMGHMTKQAAEPKNRARPRWRTRGPHDELIHRKILLAGTGGYSKGYIEHHKIGRVPSGSYVEKRMLSLTVLGAPLIRISPWFHGAGRSEKVMWDPEITVEV